MTKICSASTRRSIRASQAKISDMMHAHLNVQHHDHKSNSNQYCFPCSQYHYHHGCCRFNRARDHKVIANVMLKSKIQESLLVLKVTSIYRSSNPENDPTKWITQMFSKHGVLPWTNQFSDGGQVGIKKMIQQNESRDCSVIMALSLSKAKSVHQSWPGWNQENGPIKWIKKLFSDRVVTMVVHPIAVRIKTIVWWPRRFTPYRCTTQDQEKFKN